MRTFFSFSLLLALLGTVSAQFNFFEQMFGGNGGGGQQQHQQQNVPSDSSYYRSQVDRAYCTNYLCPDTLAHEEKVELADGQRICVSKGGYKAGEAARKVELARKGLL